jgi:hypothetical protein
VKEENHSVIHIDFFQEDDSSEKLQGENDGRLPCDDAHSTTASVIVTHPDIDRLQIQHPAAEDVKPEAGAIAATRTESTPYTSDSVCPSSPEVYASSDSEMCDSVGQCSPYPASSPLPASQGVVHAEADDSDISSLRLDDTPAKVQTEDTDANTCALASNNEDIFNTLQSISTLLHKNPSEDVWVNVLHQLDSEPVQDMTLAPGPQAQNAPLPPALHHPHPVYGFRSTSVTSAGVPADAPAHGAFTFNAAQIIDMHMGPAAQAPQCHWTALPPQPYPWIDGVPPQLEQTILAQYNSRSYVHSRDAGVSVSSMPAVGSNSRKRKVDSESEVEDADLENKQEGERTVKRMRLGYH